MNVTRLVTSATESQRITDEIIDSLIKVDEKEAAKFMSQIMHKYNQRVNRINEKQMLIENWNMGFVDKADYEQRLATYETI